MKTESDLLVSKVVYTCKRCSCKKEERFTKESEDIAKKLLSMTFKSFSGNLNDYKYDCGVAVVSTGEFKGSIILKHKHSGGCHEISNSSNIMMLWEIKRPSGSLLQLQTISYHFFYFFS